MFEIIIVTPSTLLTSLTKMDRTNFLSRLEQKLKKRQNFLQPMQMFIVHMPNKQACVFEKLYSAALLEAFDAFCVFV